MVLWSTRNGKGSVKSLSMDCDFVGYDLIGDIHGHADELFGFYLCWDIAITPTAFDTVTTRDLSRRLH